MISFYTTNTILDEFLRMKTIPNSKQVNQLLTLPRQNILSDIEDVLTQVLNNSNGKEERSLVPLHCLFLLTELKSIDSLPLLLKLCQKEDDFLEFYFDDHPTETMWQDVLIMGRNNLDIVFNFFKTGETYTMGGCIISQGLTQIALHFPELRVKIIEGLNSIYKHLYNSADYQIRYNDWLIRAVTDLNAVELLDTLKLFFDCSRMEDYTKWKDFLNQMSSYHESVMPLLSISERYNSRATPDITYDEEFKAIMAMKPETSEELEELKKRGEELFKSKGISIPENDNKFLKT